MVVDQKKILLYLVILKAMVVDQKKILLPVCPKFHLFLVMQIMGYEYNG